jgi:hypothetical protein
MLVDGFEIKDKIESGGTLLLRDEVRNPPPLRRDPPSIVAASQILIVQLAVRNPVRYWMF